MQVIFFLGYILPLILLAAFFVIAEIKEYKEQRKRNLEQYGRADGWID